MEEEDELEAEDGVLADEFEDKDTDAEANTEANTSDLISINAKSQTINENTFFDSVAFAFEETCIREEHIEQLREMSESLGSTKNKWKFIYAKFLTWYPNSKLSANALRCRLKRKKQDCPSFTSAPASKGITQEPPAKDHTSQEPEANNGRVSKKKEIILPKLLRQEKKMRRQAS